MLFATSSFYYGVGAWALLAMAILKTGMPKYKMFTPILFGLSVQPATMSWRS